MNVLVSAAGKGSGSGWLHARHSSWGPCALLTVPVCAGKQHCYVEIHLGSGISRSKTCKGEDRPAGCRLRVVTWALYTQRTQHSRCQFMFHGSFDRFGVLLWCARRRRAAPSLE